MELKKTATDLIPFIGLDLDNDTFVDTIQVLVVGPNGAALDLTSFLVRIAEIHTALVTNKDAGVLMSGRAVQAEHTFHNAVTAVNNGTATKLTLNGANRVIVGIKRTAISANEISFMATGPDGIPTPILGSKIETDGRITLAAKSSEITDEVFVFEDLAGYTDIYFSIGSLTGTSISVKGRAVG